MSGTVLLLLALLPAGCADHPAKAKPPVTATGQFAQMYASRGILLRIPDQHTAVIQHEEIPGVLPAATTQFHVKDLRDLAGLKSGDAISFQVIVTPTNGWIAHLKKF
jgi:Cu/Ag efflux protein CusF